MLNTATSNHAKALFEKVHGDGAASRLEAHFGEFSPDLTRFSFDWIFGEIYADNTLDLKTRELMNIAALVARGNEPQLHNHIRAAFNVGCTIDEIKAAIMQMIIIVGFPHVVNAMSILKEYS